MKYNGYTNWETWNVMLHASNEEDIYNDVLLFLKWASWRTGFELKCRHFFYDIFPQGTPDMDSIEEMRNVNWSEVAEHLAEWND